MATSTSPPPQNKFSVAPHRRWSSEAVCADFKEIQATAMGLSQNGQYALLGGRKNLGLVNLSQDAKSIALKVSRNVGKWEVTSVQWSPLSNDRVAIAANDRIEIVNPCNELLHEQILKSHTRYISDIDWNPKEANILASGSHDASLNIWDLRSSTVSRSRPALTFNMIVAASQVKWNKISTSVIATAHEGDVKLWDTRKASVPFMYLSAHISRVYSLDWSYHCKDQLVTSAADCYVKFFNVSSKDKCSKPISTLKTAVPVWKAKYTPFGDGLATVIVPQLQRDDHSLFLWNHKHLDFPVHSFFGHKDMITEFAWRKNQDLEMVTFSRDHTLRLWTIELITQYQCGVDPSEDNSGATSSDEDAGLEEAKEASTTNSNSNWVLGTTSEEELKTQNSQESQNTRDSTPSKTLTNKTLQQEFELLTLNLGSVKAEGLTSGKRSIKFTATVAANQAIHRVCLVVHFPVDYPSENSPPTFVFAKGTTLDSQARSNILRALRSTATEKVKNKTPCLEPCLRQLESMLAELPQHSPVIEGISFASGETAKPSPPPFPLAGATLPTSSSFTMGPAHLASYDNAHIPYPKTSGARFSPDGMTLVCFGRVAHQKSGNKSTSTPRSMVYFDAADSDSMIPVPDRKQSMLLTSNPYASVGYGSVDSNSNTLTKKGRFAVSCSEQSPISNTNSLTKKGRFRVKRIRSGSTDEGRPDSKEQSPVTGPAYNSTLDKTSFFTPSNSPPNPKVTVYDVRRLFPWNRDLAEKCTIWTRDPYQACKDNYKHCLQIQRYDLAKLWQICGKIAQLKNNFNEDPNFIPWSVHPLGQKLLTSILDHCIKIGDFQTAATILTCFWPQKAKSEKNVFLIKNWALQHQPRIIVATKSASNSTNSSPIHPKSPYLTIHGHSSTESTEVDKSKKSKFWFMKPGALQTLASPYHTIQLGSQLPAVLPPPIPPPSPTTSPVKKPNRKSRRDHKPNVTQRLPYTSSDNNLEMYASLLRHQRSNSCGDTGEEALFSPSNTIAECTVKTTTTPHVKDVWSSTSTTDTSNATSNDNSMLMLDSMPENFNQDTLLNHEHYVTYEHLKSFFAEQLYIWGFYIQRLQVLKASNLVDFQIENHNNLKMTVDCVNDAVDQHKVIDVSNEEQNYGCGTLGNTTLQCRGCLRPSLYCCICELPIRGLASCCQFCGHSGHFQHVKKWFEKIQTCPVSNCDCVCYS